MAFRKTRNGPSPMPPFVRRRQIAAVAVATRTRADVGLRYMEAPASKLLTAAKAPGQATHKLSLTSVDEITPEVQRLLRTAMTRTAEPAGQRVTQFTMRQAARKYLELVKRLLENESYS